MITRSTFLKTLLAAPAAVLALSKVAAKPVPALEQPNTVLTSSPLPLEWRVKGLAIKVPSNRWHRCVSEPSGTHNWHDYHGDWDGTFKLEAGCSNPAYILADLYERTGAEPDWAVADKSVPACIAGGPMVLTGLLQLLRPRLNWQMLYHYGQHCDELTADWTMMYEDDDVYTDHIAQTSKDGRLRPRFTLNTILSTREEMIEMRENLRMRCLQWQSTDERYRTSWPGVGYPEEGRA